MTRLERRIETRLGTDDAFAFVADFGNAMHWDPGVATSVRVGEGPTGLGSRSTVHVRMGSKVVPMEYRVTAFERTRRVVLVGAGAGVTATDEIRFTPSGSGTTIDYIADIRLHGLLGLLQPLLGRQFAALARGAVDGMRAALDARADAASDTETGDADATSIAAHDPAPPGASSVAPAAGAVPASHGDVA